MFTADTILALGDDQQAALFQVTFPDGIPGAQDSDKIALRCDQAFDPPEEASSSYDVYYKGILIPFPGSVDETAKEFTLSCRLDQQWAVYDALKNYKDAVYNPITGTRLPSALIRTKVGIQFFGIDDEVVKSWIFAGAFLRTLKVTSFEPNSTDPARIEMGWKYVKKIEG